MARKLASVQKIVDIQPIKDADKIEVAQVLGWQCVIAKKDNLKIGDLVVYIEVDSIVPDKPEFEFLRDRKFRVRTIKLRGQVSQGLVLPISYLPNKNWKEGDDVTDLLGIKKYDPQGEAEQKAFEQNQKIQKNRIAKYLYQNSFFRKIFMALQPKKERYSFPSFIKKTDEDRIQLFPDICETEKDTVFSATEKIDGQSLTAFLVKKPKHFWSKQQYDFGVCSRNFRLKENDSSWWTVARQYKLKEALEALIGEAEYAVIQGEVIGEGIQGNKYGIKGYDFYVFNIVFPAGSCSNELIQYLTNNVGLKAVPLVSRNFRLKDTIAECVEMAKGKSVLKDIQREGIVVRNNEKGLSFKIINPDFLLKYEE